MTSGSDVLAAARRSRLHWSWLPGLGALTWVLAADHFPAVGVNAAAALIVVMLVVPCVVVHELVRQLGIRSAGGSSAAVTLWPAGGVMHVASPPPSRAELRGALAAPMASIVLAASFGALDRGGSSGAVVDVLARFNAAYGIFNLIPGLPLDGGVILRAVLHARGRPFAEANAAAARAGSFFAFLLLATGVARIATGDERGGVGLAVAGLIMGGAARAHASGSPLPGRPTGRAVMASAPIAFLMLIGVSALYHPPFALAAPGTPLDVSSDIEIHGSSVAPINGRYVAASVRISEPTALHAFVSLFRGDHYLVRRSTLRPLVDDPFKPTGDAEELFRVSRAYAAVGAARAAGLPVELHGTGVRVLAAGRSARQAGFAAGDTIGAVENRPVGRLDELRRIVVSRPPGASFTLTVERAGRRLTRTIRSVAEVTTGLPYLDMLGETRDFRYELPFEIRFRGAMQLGPSAGLAYALAIADLIDPRDLARGRTIAATGRVELSGRVDPIVGAIAKQWSARAAGAALFVVAGEDATALRDPVIPVLGVKSVREAVERLLAI